MIQGDTLENRILKTIQYFDILAMPVTAMQIWRYLVVGEKEPKAYSFKDVRTCLRSSAWLKQHIEVQWGYYALKGRDHLIPERLHRQLLAAQKWKITRRVVRVLRYVPFIKMIAGSGSLALNNTNETSDLDLLIVAKSKRIWTARLLLLFMTQLTGRRRKYWNEEAPDKVCLNHYVSESHLELGVNQNIYTAILYAYLVPLTGLSVYKEFMKSNEPWMSQYVVFPKNPNLRSWHTLPAKSWLLPVTQFVENMLAEPLFDFIEKISEAIQRRAIARHAQETTTGRVVVSDEELAFHPGSKEEMIVDRFLSITAGSKT